MGMMNYRGMPPQVLRQLMQQGQMPSGAGQGVVPSGMPGHRRPSAPVPGAMPGAELGPSMAPGMGMAGPQPEMAGQNPSMGTPGPRGPSPQQQAQMGIGMDMLQQSQTPGYDPSMMMMGLLPMLMQGGAGGGKASKLGMGGLGGIGGLSKLLNPFGLGMGK